MISGRIWIARWRGSRSGLRVVRDVTEVLTSFCARLYGRRSALGRARAALAAAAEPGNGSS